MYVSVFSYRLTLVACLGMLLLSSCRGSKEVLVEEDPRSAMEKQMDTQTQELTQHLSDAVVERIPGGIRITFFEAVLFAFDSAELSDAAFESLDFFAESMHKYPGTQVLVVGHTDAIGEEAYNQLLSLQRAESVAGYIKQQNVASKRMAMTGKGESEPIDTNDTEEGRQRNRRVELIITAAP